MAQAPESDDRKQPDQPFQARQTRVSGRASNYDQNVVTPATRSLGLHLEKPGNYKTLIKTNKDVPSMFGDIRLNEKEN